MAYDVLRRVLMLKVLHQQSGLHDVLGPLSTAGASRRTHVHSAADDCHVQVHYQRFAAENLLPDHSRASASLTICVAQWCSQVVISALGMRTRRPRLESRVAPLFHWVATLGKLFTHIASSVSQL